MLDTHASCSDILTSRYLIWQELRHRLQMVSLGEGVPGADSHQAVALVSQKSSVSTQGHWVAGNKENLPRPDSAQGLDDGLAGSGPRRVEDHSVGNGSMFARPPDPPAHIPPLHGDNVVSVRRLEDPSSLIRCDR
jgi:hypothetical protein